MIPAAQFSRAVEPHEVVPANYFETLEISKEFEKVGPLEIDLGCGDGKFVTEMAEHFPERNFLAVERLLGRVRKVCRTAERKGLENLKVLRLETLYTLQWLLPEECVERVHLLCPDPWPKARHHKNRLFQQPFLEAVVRVLKPGGELCFKTDHTEYFGWCEEHLAAFAGLERQTWDGSEEFYPKTDFQLQWEAEGKSLKSLKAVKR